MTTATLTLTEFLLARIAEDEAAWSGGIGLATRPDFARLSQHMLAECEAKRRIVEMAEAEITAADAKAQDLPTRMFEGGSAFFAHNTLLRLATVYSDHPDHREDWSA